MREILFKAKRIDNGEWVEGFYFCMTHDDGRHTHHFILPLGVDLSLGTPIEKIQVEIDIETLCRYTGLTDKRGNKIWENDICSVILIGEDDIQKENFVVRYGRRAENHRIELGFNLEWIKTYYLRCDICFWTENREVETIGNIFDNPELLRGEAE